MSEGQSTLEIEIWRSVVGYEGLYEVSNLGRIRSMTVMNRGPHGSQQRRQGRILTLNYSSSYPTVGLCRNAKKKTWRPHVLVLNAFVGPCPEGMEARHFPDRDKRNNRLDNLSWGTKKENAADREVQGQSQRGELANGAKLTNEDVRRIRELFAAGQHSQEAIGKMFGVVQVTIWRIVRKKRWKYTA